MTNLVASWHIKRENASPPVDVRHYYLLLRHFVTGDEAQGTMGKGKWEAKRISPVFSFPSSFASTFYRERERETAGYEAESGRFRFALYQSQLFEKECLLYVWSFCFWTREICNASSTFPLAKWFVHLWWQGQYWTDILSKPLVHLLLTRSVSPYTFFEQSEFKSWVKKVVWECLVSKVDIKKRTKAIKLDLVEISKIKKYIIFFGH